MTHEGFHRAQTVTTEENLRRIFMAKRTAIVQPDHPKIPDCDGGTSTIDRASEQQLTEAYRLLGEVYQLLDEYAPVWYPADLRCRLQAALKPPERSPPPTLEANR